MMMHGLRIELPKKDFRTPDAVKKAFDSPFHKQIRKNFEKN